MTFQYSSVVVDLNSTAIQAGLSARDTPSVSIPPIYTNNYVFDPLLSSPSSDNDEVYTLFNDGLLYNKSSISPLFSHIYQCLNLNVDSFNELPLTLAVNSWIDKKSTNMLVESIFEDFQVPLFAIHPRQLCTAYSMSKPNSSLIVDLENDYVSVTPISNGKIIKKGIVKSNFAGDFINLFIHKFLNDHGLTDHDLLPVEFINNDATQLNPSLNNYLINQTLNDFRKSILDLSPSSIDAKIFKTCKNLKSIRIERLDQINNFINPLFQPLNCYKNTFNKNLITNQDAGGLGQLIFKSLKNIGGINQLYSNLLNNLIIQGDMSFIPNLEDFIINDLRLYIKDYQISSYLNKDDMERGIETWIGANILSKFDDLYISKDQYLENGVDRIMERFM